jgi:hypothetical protein
VGGAGVQEGEEALALDRHGQEQSLVRPDACQSVYRDHKSVSVSVRCGGGFFGRGHGRIVGCRLLVGVEEIVPLQEEQAGAYVPTHVLLIAVVAEALTTAFLHLGRREATVRPRGCRRGCCARCCSAGCGRCRQRWCASRGRGRPLLAWGKGWPWGRAGAALLRRCYRGQSPCLEGAGEKHGRLEVGRGAHLDVDPNVFREATHEELRLLARGEVP